MKQALQPLLIRSKNGLTVQVLPYGGRIQSICFQGQELTLGVADPHFYLTDSAALGASIGRYANRIADASFTDSAGIRWQLSANQAPHCLHGGKHGFAQQIWQVLTQETDALLLKLISPAGDQGFPGTLTVYQQFKVVDTVDMMGNAAAELQLSFSATTDAETVVNLTNHCYFNLARQQTAAALAAHQLTLYADEYLAVNTQGIPLPHALQSVANTLFDFRYARTIAPYCKPSAALPQGLDHCFVGRTSTESVPLRARLTFTEPSAEAATRTLELRSSQPGVQVYAGGHLTPPFAPFQGICLEAQNFPNAPNRTDFPSALLRPNTEYQQQIYYRFS